eukprot:4771323-Pyramimonas_sp.AAC.1
MGQRPSTRSRKEGRPPKSSNEAAGGRTGQSGATRRRRWPCGRRPDYLQPPSRSRGRWRRAWR